MAAALFCTLLETLAIYLILSPSSDSPSDPGHLSPTRTRLLSFPQSGYLQSHNPGTSLGIGQLSGRLIRPIPKVRRRWQCRARQTFNESKDDIWYSTVLQKRLDAGMHDGQDQKARRLLFIHDRHRAIELATKVFASPVGRIPTQASKAIDPNR